MKLLILLATVVLVAACGGGSSSSGAADAQATPAQAALELPTRSTESKLKCELNVSCKDGREIKESESSEAGCDALQEKAQHFFDQSFSDRQKCLVDFNRQSISK